VIYAFRPGTCKGRPAYTAVTWIFPSKGESFDPTGYTNACTGAYEVSIPGVDTSSWEAVGRAYMKAWQQGDAKRMDQLGEPPPPSTKKISVATVTCRPPDKDGRATCQQNEQGGAAFVAILKLGTYWSVIEPSLAG